MLRAEPRTLLLPVAFVFAPALMRCALLAEKHMTTSAADVHGFVVDLLVAVIASMLLLPLFARARWTRLLVVPWSLGHYASYEFTRNMDALPPWQSIRYLGDGTFLEASASVVSSPSLFALVLLGPGALVWMATRPRSAHRGAFSTFGIAFGALAVTTTAWPVNRDALNWRQTNFVADNVLDVLRRPRVAELPRLPADQKRVLDRLFRADLAGAPVVPRLERKPNVLLLLLEGISGADLPTLRDKHAPGASAPMAKLDAIGQENVYFHSFVTHQRGTNRGLYSTLCGDYDKLSTAVAKMTIHAAGPELECLPAVLRRNGYETVYLQAAPLAFMLKDTFMPRIGFSRTMGAESFTRSYARSSWGVDDRAFFEQVRTTVQDLRGDGKPWLLTLLTVGTHHPFPVPESFPSPEPKESFGRAARYTDHAVAEFLAALESDGALDDTLVIITSDESHGLEAGGDDLAKVLTQNLSFMVALLPTRQRRAVDELFVQADIALSIVDVLGLTADATPFIGRSAFRTYPEPRRVFIANQNARMVGMVDSRQRHVWSCDERVETCDHVETATPSFVSQQRRIEPASREDVAFLAAAQARAEGSEISPYRELSLTSDRRIPILETLNEQLLFAGQYIDAPADAELDVDVEMEAIGESGELFVVTDVTSDAGANVLARSEPITLRPGEKAVIRYSVRVGTAQHWLEARATGRKTSDGEMAVRFTRATLQVSPGLPEGTPGVVFREVRVEAPSGMD